MTTTRIRLVGAHEIRIRLGGVSRQRVYQITSRANFPQPAADLAQGKVWRTGDVDHWIHEHRPNPTDVDHWVREHRPNPTDNAARPHIAINGNGNAVPTHCHGR